MPGRRLLRLVLAVLAGSFFAAPLHAQIGEQPIRIIFPFAAGRFRRYRGAPDRQ